MFDTDTVKGVMLQFFLWGLWGVPPREHICGYCALGNAALHMTWAVGHWRMYPRTMV
jgi:hypothetical protein